MAVTTRAKGRAVSTYWLTEYACSDCNGHATIIRGMIRVIHDPKCTLRQHLRRNYPRFIRILEKEWKKDGK